MATITHNFEEQYEFAKNTTINAINSGANVLLYGSGANGKSHLIQEIKTIINDNDYLTLGEPCRIYDDNYPNELLKQCKKNKWITAVTHTEYITSSLKYCSFVFVNMNQYVYPKYSTTTN
jgi:energy-coupling factor transporter ATP-binding protein EcfA2